MKFPEFSLSVPIKTRETGDGENSICADKELARTNEGPAHGSENLRDRWRPAASPLKPGDKTGRTDRCKPVEPVNLNCSNRAIQSGGASVWMSAAYRLPFVGS